MSAKAQGKWSKGKAQGIRRCLWIVEISKKAKYIVTPTPLSHVPQSTMSFPNTVKVVVVRDKTLYKATLTLDDYTDADGKVALPPNTYSAGFCNRVWDVEWSSLPDLPKPTG